MRKIVGLPEVDVGVQGAGSVGVVGTPVRSGEVRPSSLAFSSSGDELVQVVAS